jgi:two-component SAPR family response regulator
MVKGNCMIQQMITRVSLESFRERSLGKKVVLLYPWTTYRNLFLSYFLDSAKEGLLYYRIPHNVTTLEEWLADLVDELGRSVSGFGGQLKKALASGEPEAMGQALAGDLGAYSNGQTTLFVDELDRILFDDDFVNFIGVLVDTLPENVQLAFSARMLTHQPWYNMIVEGTAIVLGTEQQKDDVMFTFEREPKPQLEIYSFGLGHALVNGQEVHNWDGALPRNLFFYFADNPLVTRDDIFATFWPTLSIKEATNVFHVTKRKISERVSVKIGDGENYEVTQYSSGFYMPGNKIARHYDVGDFQEAVDQATISQDPREEERLYRQAVALYSSPFLETIKMPWVIERRAHLAQLYSQTLIGLGRIHNRRKESREALGFLTRALKQSPKREDIHSEVMQIYLDLGMPDDARRQYRHLEQLLDEIDGLEPSEEIRKLYEQI